MLYSELKRIFLLPALPQDSLHKCRFWFQRRLLLLFLCLLCCIFAVYFCISLNNSVLNNIVKMSKADLSSFAGMFVFIRGTPESAYCWVFCICSLQLNSDSVHVCLGMALHISRPPSVLGLTVSSSSSLLLLLLMKGEVTLNVSLSATALLLLPSYWWQCLISKPKKITYQNAGWQFCWVEWMDLIYIMYLCCHCQCW